MLGDQRFNDEPVGDRVYSFDTKSRRLPICVGIAAACRLVVKLGLAPPAGLSLNGALRRLLMSSFDYEYDIFGFFVYFDYRVDVVAEIVGGGYLEAFDLVD